MLTKLQCPSCNAPLEYDGVAPTIRCPYCDSVVAVAENLRTKPAAQPPAGGGKPTPVRKQPRPAPAVHDPVYTLERPAARRSGCALAPMLLLIIIGAALAVMVMAPRATPPSIAEVIDIVTGQLPVTELSTAVQGLTDSPAVLLDSFGGEGIGPAKFEDARAIAVDNAGCSAKKSSNRFSQALPDQNQDRNQTAKTRLTNSTIPFNCSSSSCFGS